MMQRPVSLPPELLGFAPLPKGKPMDVLALDVAAGCDAALMAAVTVLWEKAALVEHFVSPSSGGFVV